MAAHGAPSPAEGLKAGSRNLRGAIREDLANDLTYFSKPSVGLLKFHGIYQQDDRDLRKTQPEKVYSAMIRVGVPGGRLTARQYLELDRLAEAVGDGTLRLTSRQDVQYHYVGKRNLPLLIQGLASVNLSSLAACGDVVRNITYPAEAFDTPERRDLFSTVLELSRHLKPKTAAYAEIWLDGERAATLEEEPLYGPTYLPRKFKIGFCYPGENTIDIYSNDLAFVAHFSAGALEGFTVLAGGGMGMSNGVKQSHPRMADEVCFIRPDQVRAVAEAVVGIHRDFGNRSNRKLARLKYVLDDRGLDWFKQELAARLGEPLAPPRPLAWTRQSDFLGWHEQGPGLLFFGLRVVNGRIGGAVRAAIREAVETLDCKVRVTAQQNLLFTGLREKEPLEAILRRHGVALPHELPPLLRHSMACPALPTCGQALTESERVAPDVVAALQSEFDAAGLSREVVHLRMTGCPNGCSRPYTAEIGIVGMSVDLYSLYLGGSAASTRLAALWRHNIKRAEIAPTLRPIVAAYAQGRAPGEAFGDWWHRAGSEAFA